MVRWKVYKDSGEPLANRISSLYPKVRFPTFRLTHDSTAIPDMWVYGFPLQITTRISNLYRYTVILQWFCVWRFHALHDIIPVEYHCVCALFATLSCLQSLLCYSFGYISSLLQFPQVIRKPTRALFELDFAICEWSVLI